MDYLVIPCEQSTPDASAFESPLNLRKYLRLSADSPHPVHFERSFISDTGIGKQVKLQVLAHRDDVPGLLKAWYTTRIEATSSSLLSPMLLDPQMIQNAPIDRYTKYMAAMHSPGTTPYYIQVVEIPTTSTTHVRLQIYHAKM